MDLISRQAALTALASTAGVGNRALDKIRALPSAQSQQVTGKLNADCISRQAAIAVADSSDYVGLSVEDVKKVTDEVVKGLKNLPSAHPEPKWIPCSERLPEDLEEVNVTWVNHDPEPYYNFVKDKPFTATAVYYKEKWYWYSSTCADLLAEYGRNPNQEVDDDIEIIAWMPLPEPYRKDGE